MKSKILVAAVLSTLSLSAFAEIDSLTINPIDIAVINAAENTGIVDGSVNINTETISFTQKEEVSIDANVVVDSTGTDTTTDVLISATNLGNRIDTSAIGAAVVATNVVTASANDFELEGKLSVFVPYTLNANLGLSVDVAALPTVYVENTAFNSADVNASVNLDALSQFAENGLGSIAFENTHISTSAIGAYVKATNTLNVGGH